MATVTELVPPKPPRTRRPSVGPEHHGVAMDFEEFIEADFQDGWLDELARGIVVVTEVPGIHHGRIVMRITDLFAVDNVAHPGMINNRAGGGECRLRLSGMKSDRHPDHAVYLQLDPAGPRVRTRGIPEIVVEVVSESGEDRDFVEKREESLRSGVREYWILDPPRRLMLDLLRLGDTWEEHVPGEDGVHRTELLPGLGARVGDLLGPPDASQEE